MTKWWMGKKTEGEPSRKWGRTHAFPELKLAGCVILQSQGERFLGLRAISNDPPTNRSNSGRRPSLSFPRPGRSSGPGRGGSAARDPAGVPGLRAPAFPSGPAWALPAEPAFTATPAGAADAAARRTRPGPGRRVTRTPELGGGLAAAPARPAAPAQAAA